MTTGDQGCFNPKNEAEIAAARRCWSFDLTEKARAHARGHWMPQLLQGIQERDAEIARLREEQRCLLAFFELVALDEAVVCRVGGSPFFVPGAMADDPKLSDYAFNLLCSDTFAYACADAEGIALDQAPEILRLHRQGGWSAVAEWVKDKRGSQFIKPVADAVSNHKQTLAENKSLREELAAVKADAEIKVANLTTERDQWQSKWNATVDDLSLACSRAQSNEEKAAKNYKMAQVWLRATYEARTAKHEAAVRVATEARDIVARTQAAAEQPEPATEMRPRCPTYVRAAMGVPVQCTLAADHEGRHSIAHQPDQPAEKCGLRVWSNGDMEECGADRPCPVDTPPAKPEPARSLSEQLAADQKVVDEVFGKTHPETKLQTSLRYAANAVCRLAKVLATKYENAENDERPI